ncbi:Argininosuccinate lyase [subsurface metagenome]
MREASAKNSMAKSLSETASILLWTTLEKPKSRAVYSRSIAWEVPAKAAAPKGETGRVYGNLMSLLTTMKSLPLAYNRDMQEDKIPLFGTVDTLKGSLSLYAKMLDTVKIDKKKMLASLEGDFSMATDLADYLVRKGLPFRKAHQIVSKLVKETIKKKKDLDDLTLKEFKTYSKLFGRDVFDTIKVKAGIAARKSLGGTAKESVKRLIAQGKEIVRKA